jgi:hypothetical protein
VAGLYLGQPLGSAVRDQDFCKHTPTPLKAKFGPVQCR